MPPVESRIAVELAVKPQQVTAAVALLDEGATVPFIALSQRRRIALTMRMGDAPGRTAGQDGRRVVGERERGRSQRRAADPLLRRKSEATA